MKGVHKIPYGPRSNPKFKELKYYMPDELIEGGLYKISARNADYGIWVEKKQGFFISRVKFDRNYLFVELHWDLSDGFGTVRPLEYIEQVPFDTDKLKDWDTPVELEKEVLKYLNVFEAREEEERGSS